MKTSSKALKEEPAARCTIAKAYGEPYVNWATKVMLGHKPKDFQFKPRPWLRDRCPSSASTSSPTWTRASGLR